jgi:hypothetical protein
MEVLKGKKEEKNAGKKNRKKVYKKAGYFVT